MKKVLTGLLSLMILFGVAGCSNEPPIYESGMTKEVYGEKFGAWLGDKLSSSNEAELEAYREK